MSNGKSNRAKHEQSCIERNGKHGQTSETVSAETPECTVVCDACRLRVDPRLSRCSVSSLVVRPTDEAVVFDRRRLCTTPCIFGNAVFRAASMNLTRADVRVGLRGNFKARIGDVGQCAEDDVEVI